MQFKRCLKKILIFAISDLFSLCEKTIILKLDSHLKAGLPLSPSSPGRPTSPGGPRTSAEVDGPPRGPGGPGKPGCPG